MLSYLTKFDTAALSWVYVDKIPSIKLILFASGFDEFAAPSIHAALSIAIISSNISDSITALLLTYSFKFLFDIF